MKALKLLTLALFLIALTPVNAQTADEIITNYLENTGGIENWKKITGTKMKASVNQQGIEIPLEIIQLKDGRQATVINFQGQVIKQQVYDGESLWGHNFLTQKAEKSDAETTENFKLNLNDFPSAFIDYKDKGYTAELLGKETIEGTECFKIKFVQEPITVDGKKEESIAFNYFDTENFILIAVESTIPFGPQKGTVQLITFGDYQEVDGLYFPFSLSQGIKGGASQPVNMTSVELNPVVDDKVFAFPEN